MQLKIREVSRKDEGLYKCVITFANKTVQTTARLTVFQDKSTKISRIEGKCVKYEQGENIFPFGRYKIPLFHINWIC